MRELNQEELEEYKRIFEKQYGYKINDKEAYDGARNLLLFVKTLVDIEYRNQRVGKNHQS
ncbi:MAG: hypothetical protein WC495_04555 [Patescibacteria group bacterium]|jgi:hypothetical protein